MKNLDPPMRTSFLSQSPGGRRGWDGARREGPASPGCSAGKLALEPNQSGRRSTLPEERRSAQESSDWGGLCTCPSSPPPEPVVKAETMERAPGDARRRDCSSAREGRAGRRGEEEKGGVRGEAGAPRPLPRGLLGPQAPSSDPRSRDSSPRPPSLADSGYAKLLRDRVDLISRC